MKAAIVGAGIAGLRIAVKLREQGADVEVFEKSRGPSGRLATRRTPEGHFDHGAQYFTARTPAFRAQVKDWQSRGVVQEWTGRIVRLDSGVVSEEPDASVRYVGTPRMSVLARDLLEGTPAHFSVRVESLWRDGLAWTLRTDRGIDHNGFDMVVVAVPAPQAVPLLEAKPEFATRAGQVRLLPCHALMARFEKDLEADFDAAFVRSSALGWIARNASKPGRAPGPTWVLHSTSQWSEDHLELSPSKIRAALLESLEAALGKSLPETAFFAVHRWLYARASGFDAGPPVWDPDLRLGACGDWVKGDRVEDAYLSAEVLADAIRESDRRRRDY